MKPMNWGWSNRGSNEKRPARCRAENWPRRRSQCFTEVLNKKQHTSTCRKKTRGRLAQTGERLTGMAQEYSALATWRDDPTPGSAGVFLKSALMSWSVAGVRPQLLFPFLCCVYRVYSFSSSSSLNPPKFSHISFGSAHGKGSAPH